MKVKPFWLLSFSIVLLGLSTCSRSSSPPCSPSDLEPPTLTSPGHYYHVGTIPTTGALTPEFFQWEFDPDCTPEHFKIRFSPDRHFGIARSGMTDGELTWPPTEAAYPQAPLEPATEYFWNVRAWTDGVNGPESEMRVFFTGPLCSAASELGSPALISPDPGEVINELYAELHYQAGEPKCVPDGYLIDLQTDPTFSGTNLLTAYSNPGTYVHTDELADCTTYYWRVAPLFGETQGPFSETRAFTVAVASTCVVAEHDLAWLGNLDVLWPPDLPCDPEQLPAPDPTYPPSYAYIGESATIGSIPAGLLQWEYGCQPSGFELRISTDRHFANTRIGETEGERSWPVAGEVPQAPLEPGSQYYWNVNGLGIKDGPASSTFSFFTGPQCTNPSDLVPPRLIKPDDAAVITEPVAELHYVTGEPKCLPDGYFIDLQTDPDFNGTTLLVGYGFPGTHLLTDPLEDCQTYYWRVAAIEDGVHGPFSDVRSFSTDLGTICSYLTGAQPMATALIDLACIQGPKPEVYPTLGYMLAGESSPIVAQSLDRGWWYILNPDGMDICAIPKDDTESEGNLDGVPLWHDPGLAADDQVGGDGSPVCSASLSQTDCAAAGGSWNMTMQPGYCDCP